MGRGIHYTFFFSDSMLARVHSSPKCSTIFKARTAVMRFPASTMLYCLFTVTPRYEFVGFDTNQLLQCFILFVGPWAGPSIIICSRRCIVLRWEFMSATIVDAVLKTSTAHNTGKYRFGIAPNKPLVNIVFSVYWHNFVGHRRQS